MLTTLDAYLALNLLPKVGPIRVKRMIEQFGSPEAVLAAPIRDLLRVPGIGEEMAAHIAGWEQQIDLMEEKRRMREHGVSLLSIEDPLYPPALKQIHDAPFLLYMRGSIRPADEISVAVVGSRRMTHYGRDQSRKLSFQLAKAGFTIVSGLARGIDTAAHEAAIAAGGRTIAVLGSGIGNVFPPENQALADRIAENGAVLSEFPVLYVPDKQSFPLRNRIVAGMSRGIIVVEAPAWSGALITANQAIEQGRTVFAVPGPIDRPSSVGCNRLIQSGAKLVCDAEDIIQELDLELNSLPLDFSSSPESAKISRPTVPARQAELSPLERQILDQLELGPSGIDALSEVLSLAPGPLSVTLLQMEMKHLIRQHAGKTFTKAD